MDKPVQDLYLNAGFFNRMFFIWAYQYVKWINKRKTVKDFKDIVMITENEKTGAMFEKFHRNRENLQQKWRRYS